MEPDFSGWATKAGLKCSDGRTIMPDAFKHMDKMTVPLVYQHGHNNIDNVLGHVVLENLPQGVRAHGFFNETPAGQKAKLMVQHKDLDKLSIFANQIVEKVMAGTKAVLHGMIREVSLVLSGANPGAVIDYVRIQHSDDVNDYTESETEAIIHTGELLELEHAAASATIQDVFDTLDDDQKKLVHYMIAAALEAAGKAPQMAQSAVEDEGESDDKKDDKKDEGDLTHQEGKTDMTARNVFEQNNKSGDERHVLTHDAIKGILADATKPGNTLKSAVEAYAIQHGITNIGVMFPDAKALADRPEFNKRRTEWVAGVLNGTRKSPFSRVKTLVADITVEEARARGYVKGNFKKEEFFAVTKRTTSPTTIYKKQKLDRDDILDITDFDVVAWLKFEMRLMLDEEVAISILIGDGRDPADDDKVKDPVGATDGIGIRSILNDHELYVTTVNVNVDDAASSYMEVIESVLRARRFYKGTGTPTFYTTAATLVEMLLARDTTGNRFWRNKAELAADLMVADIVEVEAMERQTDLLGIIVNLEDYNVGADRGGEVNLFDDFDIDYNQYKYLMETRVSGALVKIKSALVIKKTAGTNVLVAPTVPTFNKTTGVVTIPTKTGVVYKNDVTNATLSAGAQTPIDIGVVLKVRAEPTSGYYFATNAEDQWTFTGVTDI